MPDVIAKKLKIINSLADYVAAEVHPEKTIFSEKYCTQHSFQWSAVNVIFRAFSSSARGVCQVDNKNEMFSTSAGVRIYVVGWRALVLTIWDGLYNIKLKHIKCQSGLMRSMKILYVIASLWFSSLFCSAVQG